RMLKCLMLGDSGVGKTAFSTACLKKPFYDDMSTIGIEMNSITLPNDKKVTMYDTAGQEKFRAITRAYYRDKHIVFLLYEATRRDTFDNCRWWAKDMLENCGERKPTIKILIANKIDLKGRMVSKEEGLKLAEDLGFLYYESNSRGEEGRFKIQE
ncbi:hypothetical protein SAMD00019534_097340, partial [Acytostelium subglobosum LB1]|uniref:hypothetical protein n=1 Tax=Acytostelium subglobosum LB1 TaxID=1410327 RepID=UPI0006448E7F